MDTQKEIELFEELLLANPDFDESLLAKDEDGDYENCEISDLLGIFQAGIEVAEREARMNAKAQAVLKSPVMAFDEWFKKRHEKTGLYEEALCGKDDATYIKHEMNKAFQAGRKEKQAVPEGFVLVPKQLSDELADELASDAFNNIQSVFDYEHRASTATHREQIRLRWCKNKARKFQENYKIVIEAQEQSHD